MSDLPPSLAVKPNIPIYEQTDEQLRLEYEYWDKKVKEATGWGASLKAADDFRWCCKREMERRAAIREEMKEP